MQRTNVIELKPSRFQEKLLKELMLLSSCVYNSTNYLVRQQFFNAEKISRFHDLQQKLQHIKDYQLLGRSYALPRIQIYAETNSARFKLIKSKTQDWVGLPKYYKNRKTNTTLPSYLVMDGCQYSIGKNKVIIPLSRQMRKRYGIKHFKVPYNGVLRWRGQQMRGQIHLKDGKFYLHQAVELKDKRKVKSKIVAGIDLGIKRTFGICTSNGEENIIGSKRFFRQWQYLTNLIAKEQQKLSLINKKSSNNLQILYSKRGKYLNNLYNNLVAKLFRILRRNKVSKIYVGYPKNILDSDKGRKLNQMTHNYWSFDLLLKRIENKAEEFGIQFVPVSEEYTSRTCPMCYDASRSNDKDRIFLCSFCGYVDHRDIVGARNMMLKGMCGLEQSAHWGEIAPLEVA